MSHSARPPVGTRLERIGWNNPVGLTEEVIRAVVDRFYADARLDPLIGPVFNNTIAPDAWPAHLSTIADFWSSMLLGSGRYTGRPMPKHMALPELTDAHFQRWLALFRRTVEQLCTPEIAEIFIERSERVGNSFRMNIAMRRGEDIKDLAPLARESLPWAPPQ